MQEIDALSVELQVRHDGGGCGSVAAGRPLLLANLRQTDGGNGDADSTGGCNGLVKSFSRCFEV